MAIQSLTFSLKNNTSLPLLPIVVQGADNSGLPQMIQPGDTGTCVMKLDANTYNSNLIQAMVICNISSMGAVVITANCGFEGKNQYQATALGVTPASFDVSPDPNWPNNDANPTLSLTLT